MNDTFDFIENTACNLRHRIMEKYPQIKGSTVELLKKTVELFGGTILGTNNPMYYEIKGERLFVREKGCFYIKLPLYTTPLRDCFTIAHDLGHYIMHYNETKGECVFPRFGNNTDEVQANRFAAAFLMPKNEFLRARNEYKDSIPLIAAHFQVTTNDVFNRMKYLK